MIQTPVWAQKLVSDAIKWYTKQEHVKAKAPGFIWRHRIGLNSSGHTRLRENQIFITAGRNRVDLKLCILHELAHCLAPREAQFHTVAFWDITWKLIRWAKLPIRYCKQREGEYKKGALVAYRRGRCKK